MAKGFLVINAYTDNLAQPLKNVSIKITGESFESIYMTDENGSTKVIELECIDKKYTEKYQTEIKPFNLYNLEVDVLGLVKTKINNIEIYDGVTSIQSVFLTAKKEDNEIKEINLTATEIWGSDTPKILETFVKENSTNSKVLSQVIIPEYIIVHNGIPTDSNAANYIVSFVDYVKNVACSEIYSTWPIETIKANVYCIISFALNRIYTEWYKTKGYNFSITSSPAYDQKYTHQRPIFDSISNIVDEIFINYINKSNVVGPLLALYCDGIVSNHKGWFKQWGAKELGDKGLSAIEILKTYYGNNISLQTAVKVEGLPISYPGYTLKEGDCRSRS